MYLLANLSAMSSVARAGAFFRVKKALERKQRRERAKRTRPLRNLAYKDASLSSAGAGAPLFRRSPSANQHHQPNEPYGKAGATLKPVVFR